MPPLPRLLIVDDDKALLDLLTELLRRDYDVRTAHDAEEGFELARSERFDVILLDVMMPRLDGYRFAMELTSKDPASAPKVVIMTARDVKLEHGVAVMSGAVTALQKPFTPDDLRVTLRNVLGS